MNKIVLERMDWEFPRFPFKEPKRKVQISISIANMNNFLHVELYKSYDRIGRTCFLFLKLYIAEIKNTNFLDVKKSGTPLGWTSYINPNAKSTNAINLNVLKFLVTIF